MKEKKKFNALKALTDILDEKGIDYEINNVNVKDLELEEDGDKEEALKILQEKTMQSVSKQIRKVLDSNTSAEDKAHFIMNFIHATFEPVIDLLGTISDEMEDAKFLFYFEGKVDDREFATTNIPTDLETDADIIKFFGRALARTLEQADDDE